MFYFNPRAPRGARLPNRLVWDHWQISIHVPREGHDAIALAMPGNVFISIHVPREGHDPTTIIGTHRGLEFQSTCPARGTTNLAISNTSEKKFQSTCPARGTTRLIFLPTTAVLHFNPRAPRGARPSPPIPGRRDIRISIHVPREGHDPYLEYLKDCESNYFNPRAPRGARHKRINHRGQYR